MDTELIRILVPSFNGRNAVCCFGCCYLRPAHDPRPHFHVVGLGHSMELSTRSFFAFSSAVMHVLMNMYLFSFSHSRISSYNHILKMDITCVPLIIMMLFFLLLLLPDLVFMFRFCDLYMFASCYVGQHGSDMFPQLR